MLYPVVFGIYFVVTLVTVVLGYLLMAKLHGLDLMIPRDPLCALFSAAAFAMLAGVVPLMLFESGIPTLFGRMAWEAIIFTCAVKLFFRHVDWQQAFQMAVLNSVLWLAFAFTCMGVMMSA